MTTLRRKRKNLIFKKKNLTLGSSVFWLSYNRITGVVTSAPGHLGQGPGGQEASRARRQVGDGKYLTEDRL